MLRSYTLGVILIPIFVACSSDDNENPGGGTTDAGKDSSTDTGGGGSADSGLPDGTTEAAPEAEAGPQTWPVHIDVAGHDSAGTTVSVLSSLPDGSIYGVTALDPSGKMDAAVVDGGSVHLLVKNSSLVSGSVFVSRTVHSHYSITEESTVTQQLYYGVQNTPVGDVTFYPDGTFPGGTTSVRVWSPCNNDQANSGNPYAGILFDDMVACAGATEYWAAAIAFNAAGKAISAQLLEHLPVASSPTTIYISFGSPASFASRKTTFTALSADATQIKSYVGVGNPTGTTYSGYFPTELFSKGAPAADGSVEVAAVTKNFSQFAVGDSVTWTEVAQLHRSTGRTQVVTTLSDSVWDATAVARVESVSQLDLTELDRPSLSYSLESTGEVGECIETFGSWYESSGSTYWQARGPAQTSGVLKFPALPTDFEEFALSAGQTVDNTSAKHFSPTVGDCRSYDQNQLAFVSTGQTPSP